MADDGLYFGFDLSTQQVKVAVTDQKLNLKYETAIKFDTDLREFKTQGGAHVHNDKLTVTAPTLMWVKGMDLCLEKMKEDGIDFSKVLAIAGDAQQHGSVYWKRGASEILSNLNSDKYLHEQLTEAFSVSDSPIWLDASTDLECKKLEDTVGGAMSLSEMTGARCFHRFTGAHIAKLYSLYPDIYNQTERISLVSSFVCTLLVSRYAPIDYGDGSGMSLMEIRRKTWIDQLLQTCAPNLSEKLGQPVPSYTEVGSISKYLVDRYGFSPDCRVMAFTGDNMASVAGIRLQQGEILFSMGTSDTIILSLSEPKPNLYSCQIANPVLDDSYTALLCFKNSSLTRERVMKERAGSWEKFNQILTDSPRGNHGNIGIYFDIPEVTPAAVGLYRFDKDNNKVSEFDAATEIRAVIESQLLARRYYSEQCGIDIAASKRVLATGGASANPAILQAMADIFNVPVYTIDIPNSACLGNCYRAKHGLLGGANKCDFFTLVSERTGLQCAATPSKDSQQIYTPLLKRYRELEKLVEQTCEGGLTK